MDSCALRSFSDELEKIAKVRATRRQLREMVKKLYPAQQFDLNLRNPRDLRIALQSGAESFPVPLAKRLESYKHWKRTGTLPRADIGSRGGKLDVNFEKGVTPHPMKYVRSNEPVTVYSGGADPGLSHAIKSPGSSLDHPVLIPGKQRVQTKGLYAAGPDDASRYMRADKPHLQEPAMAKITVPRSQVVGHGYETMIPRGAKMEAKIQYPGDSARRNRRAPTIRTPTVPR